MADPLDRYTSAAVAAATGRTVRIVVAIPIELDAALDRLYPKNATPEPAGSETGDADEADAERLKDLASEAPIIRMVNTIIARAVETGASDIHIEPFEDRLRIRYRRDGILEESERSAARLRGRGHLAHQDHGPARHRRAPHAAGRPHPPAGARPGRGFSASPPSRPCTGRRWCCACWTAARSRSNTPSWACRRVSSRRSTRRWRCRTASCW